MSPNSHLAPQLDVYTTLKQPGFAMMIDAPWGAGKTFALNTWLRGKKYLYVSLYGVANKDEIERAIFLARLALIDNGTTRAVATLLSAGMDALASHYKVKNSLNIAELGQAALPPLLVFDDLERASMAPNDLLSVLNKYVEHEKKNVILIGNQVELRRKSSEYENVREKVVGRIISIVPDVTPALASFLSEIGDQPGQKEAEQVLLLNEVLIVDAFRATGVDNLRLLRQALFELARHYSNVPDKIKENNEGIKYLIATFIALCISYHSSSEFGPDGLMQKYASERKMWEIGGRKGVEPPLAPIELLIKNCADIEYVSLRGNVLSPRLAVEWIVKGHADASVVKHELEKAAVFNRQYTAAWQTLWHWQTRSAQEVELALSEVKEQLQNMEITHPSVILHVFGIMLDLGAEGIEWETEAAAEEAALQYIANLESEGKLPAEFPMSYTEQHIFEEANFGLSYISRTTTAFAKVQIELSNALDRAFWNANDSRLAALFELIRTEPAQFAGALDGSTYRPGVVAYHNIPVLRGMNTSDAAALIFREDPLVVHKCLSPFKARFQRFTDAAARGDSEAAKEVAWLSSFRMAAEQLAMNSSDVVAAQIRRTIKRQLDL